MCFLFTSLFHGQITRRYINHLSSPDGIKWSLQNFWKPPPFKSFAFCHFWVNVISKKPWVRASSTSLTEKAQGLKGGGFQKFCRLHFFYFGELRWLMYIWVICPWNKFGKKTLAWICHTNLLEKSHECKIILGKLKLSYFPQKLLLKYDSSLVAVRRIIALTFFCHTYFSDKSIFLSKYIVWYALSRPIDYLTFKFTF